MKTGFFIVFEGPEGVGKSTQIAKLARFLKGLNYSVVVTREPGGTPVGQKLRALILEEDELSLNAWAEFYLFLSDRAQHVATVIRPALKKKQVVICDRFFYSSMVYQGIVEGLGAEKVRSMSLEATQGLVPDLVFFLDAPLQEKLKRLKKRSKKDKNDRKSLAFHARIGRAFKTIAQSGDSSFHFITSSDSAEKVFEKVKNVTMLNLA